MSNNIRISHYHHVIEAPSVSGCIIDIASIIHKKLPAITQRKMKFNIGSLSLNPKKLTTKALKRVFIFHHNKNNILMKTIIIDLKYVVPINQNNSAFPELSTGLIFAIGRMTRATAKTRRKIVNNFWFFV